MTSKELQKLQIVDWSLLVTETIVSELRYIVEFKGLIEEDLFEEDKRRAIAFVSKLLFEKTDEFGASFVALVVSTLNHLGISAKEEFDEKGRCISLLVGDEILLQRLFLGC